jgi:ABC-type dipeptide/oligopeptide/nickel transport system permease subunit
MDNKPMKYDIFRMNDEKIASLGEFKNSDFDQASSSEKESMVEKRKSISYWADAWRRFKANKVAMVSLGIFIIMMFFAFIGPKFLSYDYKNQYRNSVKLGPFQYSKDEQAVKDILKSADGVYATSLIPGSTPSLKEGTYYFKIGGKNYCFKLDKKLNDGYIIYNSDDENVLSIGSEKNLKDGVFSKTTPLEYSTTVEKGATKLTIAKSVFPHFFGTDSSGRDIMARCMYGARVSLLIGIVAALIVLVIGSIYGAVSGLCGGAVDFVMMRIIDFIISIPSTLMVLLLQVVVSQPLQNWFDGSKSSFVKGLSDLGVGIVSIFITFALLYWVGMARLIRGQVLQLKQQEYVTAARALGASNKRIVKRHLLPNCVGQLVVATCLEIPSAIFMESFLSFLGMGVSAPMASLGSLCSDGMETITLYPYRLVFPAVILTIIVLTLNLIGDGIRDALDPRLKK